MPSLLRPPLGILRRAELLDFVRRRYDDAPPVTDLNVDETIAIWMCYDEYRTHAGFPLSARALREIIRSELDVHAELEG